MSEHLLDVGQELKREEDEDLRSREDWRQPTR